MSDTDEHQDRLIRLLAPTHRLPDDVASPDASGPRELARLITRVSTVDKPRWGRRLALGVPAVAALAAAVALGIAVLPRSEPARPVGTGPVASTAPVDTTPPRAHVLQFVKADGYLTVRIIDPVADPKRYKAEFAAYGLNMDLSLAPVTRDQVGKVIFSEIDQTDSGPGIDTIEDPGHCTANGNCSVGLRIPLTFKGYANFVFGRTARPGEKPDTPTGGGG